MAIRLVSDMSTVVPFPGGQPERPSIELVARLSPSRSLVDTLMAERGLASHDARAGLAREMAYQARALEQGHGRDETIVRLRGFVDAHIAHAAEICRAYRDAADRLVCREVEVAQAARVEAHVRSGLAAARDEVHGRAIAARIAADAAQGAAAALVAYIREGLGGLAVSDVEPRQLLLFAAAAS
jgi:hypothetical protein